MTVEKKYTAKRPPFDFKISSELENAINCLVDMIEEENVGMQGAWENEVHALSRELPEGSEEEHWIIDYYVNAGWLEDTDDER